MNRWLILLGLLGALLVACSGGKDLDTQLREVDQALVSLKAMTAQQKDDVTKLTAEARQLIASGKKDEAAGKVDKAMKIVQKARDADTFNKAE